MTVQELKRKSQEIKRIFFYRICGSGMGAAAKLLRDAGLEVEGGDVAFAPPVSYWLESTGIPLHILTEVADEQLKGFDLIVVGNVVPKDSPDAVRIEGLGIPYTSFSAVLGAVILPDRRVVGIAGTHGKTTTTYFFVQVFERLGERPGYLIGGVLEGREPSCLGEGEHFFIESDEYDSAYFEKISKFRLYGIDQLVLTSLEFDHADIFHSLEDIKEQFRPLLKELPTPVIFCDSYPAAKELRDEFDSRWIAYGSTGPALISSSPKGSEFELNLDGRREKFTTNIVGEHNLGNLSAVILYALRRGYSLEAIREAIVDLKMVKRRQEVRGLYKGAVVVDDFAHHPKAVEATIAALKVRYPDKRMNVIFEPHSATARSDIFREEFLCALRGADEVVLVHPSRQTTVAGAQNLNLDSLAAGLPHSSVVVSLEELRERLDSLAKDGAVILVLSNGTCLGLWQSNFIKEIQ